MEEIWIDVKDYEGLYQVSNWGRVKSLEREEIHIQYGKQVVRHLKERILIPRDEGTRHLQVSLCKNGKKEMKHVYRLVAEAFLPNPNNYNAIHHIDRNPLNNRLENLEWMDRGKHQAMHRMLQIKGEKKHVNF